jgi:tetratricopeptide (TPR) repeat protein
MRLIFLSVLVAGLAVSGCASVPGDSAAESKPAAASAPPPPAAPEPTPESAQPAAESPAESQVAEAIVPIDEEGTQDAAPQMTSDLLYRLMMAEIAGQRGELDVAVKNYVEAALLSRDERIVERATRVAVYARDDDSTLSVATLWVELNPENIEARQVAAAMYVRRGDADQALQHLEKVVELRKQGQGHGDDGNGYQLATALLSKEKDKETALEVMSKLVSKRQDDPYAFYSYGQLALLMNELGTANTAAKRALELKPGWTQAVILQSSILMRQGKNNESLEVLKTALENSPNSNALRMYYARRLVDVNRLEAARDQFQRVLEYDADNTDAIYALGLLSIQLEDLDSAEKQFALLVKSGRRVNEASYYLGQIEETRRNYDKAMQWYGVVRSGQYLIEAQIRTAVVIMRKGDLAGARTYLQNVEATSSDVQLRLYLAESGLLSDAGEHREAFDLLTDALGDMPDNTQLLYTRALAAERIDRLDIAEQDLKSILDREPNNAQALNALGYTLADRSNRLQEALGFIERAYKLQPDDPAILDSVGWVNYRLGNYEKALKYLRRAFDMIKDPEIAAHLGEVLWVTGDHNGAREVWGQAVKASPDHELLQDVIRRFTE